MNYENRWATTPYFHREALISRMWHVVRNLFPLGLIHKEGKMIKMHRIKKD